MDNFVIMKSSLIYKNKKRKIRFQGYSIEVNRPIGKRVFRKIVNKLNKDFSSLIYFNGKLMLLIGDIILKNDKEIKHEKLKDIIGEGWGVEQSTGFELSESIPFNLVLKGNWISKELIKNKNKLYKAYRFESVEIKNTKFSLDFFDILELGGIGILLGFGNHQENSHSFTLIVQGSSREDIQTKEEKIAEILRKGDIKGSIKIITKKKERIRLLNDCFTLKKEKINPLFIDFLIKSIELDCKHRKEKFRKVFARPHIEKKRENVISMPIKTDKTATYDNNEDQKNHLSLAKKMNSLIWNSENSFDNQDMTSNLVEKLKKLQWKDLIIENNENDKIIIGRWNDTKIYIKVVNDEIKEINLE